MECKEIYMIQNPTLGDVIKEGACGEYRVYTMRGWIRCDDITDRDVELDNIRQYLEAHTRKEFT